MSKMVVLMQGSGLTLHEQFKRCADFRDRMLELCSDGDMSEGWKDRATTRAEELKREFDKKGKCHSLSWMKNYIVASDEGNKGLLHPAGFIVRFE